MLSLNHFLNAYMKASYNKNNKSNQNSHYYVNSNIIFLFMLMKVVTEIVKIPHLLIQIRAFKVHIQNKPVEGWKGITQGWDQTKQYGNLT